MAQRSQDFDAFMAYLAGQDHGFPNTFGPGVDRAPPHESSRGPNMWEAWAQGGPNGPGGGAGNWGGPWAGAWAGRRGPWWARGGPPHGWGPVPTERQAGPSNTNDAEVTPPQYTDNEKEASAEKTDDTNKNDNINEKQASVEDAPDATMKDDPTDPPVESPEDPFVSHRGFGCGRGRGGPWSFRGCGGRARHHHGGPPPSWMWGDRHGGPGGRRGGWGGQRGGCRGGPPPPPAPPGAEGGQAPFDMRAMLSALANQPFAHQIREFLERMQNPENGVDRAAPDAEGDGDKDEQLEASFTPPVDVFDLGESWTLHVSIPGAKKEDVGVNWDADRSVLSITGIVHRAADEEYVQGLISSERAIGMFKREITLPPTTPSAAAEERDQDKEQLEVDEENITARMEDGILIVTVPKVGKDWTEVKKVEIE